MSTERYFDVRGAFTFATMTSRSCCAVDAEQLRAKKCVKFIMKTFRATILQLKLYHCSQIVVLSRNDVSLDRFILTLSGNVRMKTEYPSTAALTLLVFKVHCYLKYSLLFVKIHYYLKIRYCFLYSAAFKNNC